MSNRPMVSAHNLNIRLLITALMLLFLFSVTGAWAATDDDPTATREKILEHRLQEAASKARLVKGLMAAEAAKTFNQTNQPHTEK